jgi:hypothetical protein
MDMAHHDDDELKAARRDLIRSVAILTIPVFFENTLESHNVWFHAEEFMKSLDAFYADSVTDDEAAGTG